ncbi:hypothetical protein BD626DRAFT_583677 [Schizophyllum amplum]|uniref:AAA-ATPase-like domain-containing protein n=1 Tax=Schizophyllum amplum TaxID=97359 RepID=A0A550CEQ0_9AGAR|nr:hypothetical protein BD626DRAFT_583677 [Auriculariopsis ampla]
MAVDEDLRFERVICFFLDHDCSIFMFLRRTRLSKQREATFADVYEDVIAAHARHCRCGGTLGEARISTRRISDLEPDALKRSFAVTDMQVNVYDQVIPALARHADGNRQSIIFALTPSSPAPSLISDTGSSSDEELARPPIPTSFSQWVNRSVCIPHNVCPCLPSLADNTFSSIRDHCFLVDKSPYIPLLHSPEYTFFVLRRPPGYGRSVFLSATAELHDVLSSTRCESIWSRRIAEGNALNSTGRVHPFVPNCDVVLHLDMSCLNVTTSSTLESSITSMLRGAVNRFIDKYRYLLKLTDDEMAFALASDRATQLLLRASARAQSKGYRSTYLCIDNYTAPFEKTVDQAWTEWPACISILNTRLYEPIMLAMRAGNISGGILVGSSALDDHIMTFDTYSRPPNDGKLNYATCETPPLVPFTGELSNMARDMTEDPRMQGAIGMTREEVMDLASACLRPSQLPRVQELLAKLPSQTFVTWECRMPVATYGSVDVLKMLRGLQSEESKS